MNNLLKRKRKSKFIFVFGASLLILAFIFIFLVFLPFKKIYSLSLKTTQSARLAYEYLKKQDVNKASDELKITSLNLQDTKKAYSSVVWMKYIPFLGSYVSDGQKILNAGGYSLEAGQIMVDSIKPYADVLGFKGQGSFVMGTAEERIQKAVKTLEKVIPNTSRILAKMELADRELEGVNTNKYFFKIKNINVKENLDLAKNGLKAGVLFMKDAEPAIKILPKLLGEPNAARYIVLFQNDKELRATGGFLTAYSVFKVTSGKIVVEKSEDIYELDKRINSHEPAPQMILKYLKNVFYLNARDTNIYPDFKVSMDKFYSLYKRDDKTKIDGIIAVDTQFLVDILKVIGPVDVYGIKFGTENDPRCKCPQVVYELESLSTTQVDYVKTGRKDIIGQLMFAIMKKVLSSPPKIYWGPVIQASVKMLGEKHFLIYLFDKEGQRGIESLNWAGRVNPTAGDYLYINDTNLGGAKTDMFITRSVEETVDTREDKTSRHVTIKYNNPYPASNCNLEQKQVLCLNSLYRSLVRVYVPKGSKLIDKETRGSETKVKTYDEFGKTVFEGFFTMYPEHQATLEFSYEVPIIFSNEYDLLIQKQPGLTQVQYTTTINGKTQILDLLRDEEVKVKL